jgi:hypothetical protein
VVKSNDIVDERVCFKIPHTKRFIRWEKFLSLGRKSEIRVPTRSGFGESPLLSYTLMFSHCTLTWWDEVRALSGISFARALIPLIRALVLWLDYLPKALLLITIKSRVRISTWALGRDKNILSHADIFNRVALCFDIVYSSSTFTFHSQFSKPLKDPKI